jgi:hypothetical protein
MSNDYEVGYRKPPEHSRFKKGRSGNPQGRPKGSKNLQTDLAEELNERILVREGSRSMTLTKQRAIVKSLVSKAAKGDPRSMNVIANLIRTENPPDGSVGGDEPISIEDQEVLELIAKRYSRRANNDENQSSMSEESEGGDHESV